MFKNPYNIEGKIIKLTPTEYNILLFLLKNKGKVEVGYDADLVLFDYDRIQDHADFEDPFKPNEGIHMVFIQGQCVLKDNEPTGKWLGKYIKREN